VCLPSAVAGPVDSSALARFAARRAALDMGNDAPVRVCGTSVLLLPVSQAAARVSGGAACMLLNMRVKFWRGD
jgi:hypothetical protein